MKSKKVVLISGGGKGIGATIARYFHAAGYGIVLNYRTSKKQAEQVKADIEKEGGEIEIFQADLSVKEERVEMIKAIESLCPSGIDVLVNNAGVYVQEAFESMSDESFEECLSDNLKTAVFLTRDCLGLLRKKQTASVIFLSSGSAFSYTKESACFSYAVSKAAIVGATKALAVELAPAIRVNCVVPTYIRTDMLMELSEEEIQKKRERTLLKKVGDPEDVASAILFLASQEAGYITGQSLHINGGRYLA